MGPRERARAARRGAPTRPGARSAESPSCTRPDPSGAGRRGRGGPGAEGRRGRERGRAAGDTRALEAGRGDPPSARPPARPGTASLWARSRHRACRAGPDSRRGGAACGHHFLRAGDTHPGRHGGAEAAVAAQDSGCTCIMGAAAAAPLLCAFFSPY